jgi:hypothetical protein
MFPGAKLILLWMCCNLSLRTIWRPYKLLLVNAALLLVCIKALLPWQATFIAIIMRMNLIFLEMVIG